jgi:hypothetical protein
MTDIIRGVVHVVELFANDSVKLTLWLGFVLLALAIYLLGRNFRA